jgi:hypothetical protein
LLFSTELRGSGDNSQLPLLFDRWKTFYFFFLAAGFFAAGFLAAGFFAAGFLVEVFLVAVVFFAVAIASLRSMVFLIPPLPHQPRQSGFLEPTGCIGKIIPYNM